MTKTLDYRFELQVGTPKAGKLEHSAPIGFSIQPDGESYYVIRLWTYPRTSFYLVHVESDAEKRHYTLYARKTEGPHEVTKFQNPVGRGETHGDLIGMIEVWFRFPRERFFLILRPK